MAPLLLPFLPIFIVAATTAATNSYSYLPVDPLSLRGLTAYDVLQAYNFPIGLLPKGSLGYDLDPRTGKFSAYFNGTCEFALESYQISYKSTITGRISTNHLTELRGVSVKVLLFWINIIEVVRDGDEINFSVGIASASFDIGNFYICPQCGCGLNCNSSEIVRRKAFG
ncbi:hypothetical protein HPP92_013246 [Vanilla planifolia]|uniref:Uncharacterized protein n=1 Tax=Vanilla planifolia TaxID=51239 RepID=A0A835QYS9_VANPL|nr:hypothetical protein HPP92_013724 [Vanilla planifolia]KAG0478527.1 hypothetical protein HPP92_013246 [Vanilla planifolia]